MGGGRDSAREKTRKKGKEKDGEKTERKKGNALVFYSFARAKCYLRFCNASKITFSFQYFACDQS